jgi:starvation-inducible DNA-binding protein
MYPTKNDLAEEARARLCDLLSARLADAIDLVMQAKQAHWNVKGGAFYALHKLFDEIADGVRAHVDEVAERIAQLGGVAEGTVGAVKKRTGLAEYPLAIADGSDHLEAMRAALAKFAATTRKSINEATEARDPDTEDLLTEVSRAADKYLWLVEAHLQTAR